MMFEILIGLSNTQVLVEFDWFGTYEEGEPEWETMKVHCLLPFSNKPEGKMWVVINDLLSDEQWHTIESEIYSREDELHKQALENEF